jgi:hypothetical protein
VHFRVFIDNLTILQYYDKMMTYFLYILAYTNNIIIDHSVIWFQWLNGQLCVDHEGGHLPFTGDATNLLKYGESNLIVVAVNNTLTPDTIPQGFTTFPNNTYKYKYIIFNSCL